MNKVNAIRRLSVKLLTELISWKLIVELNNICNNSTLFFLCSSICQVSNSYWDGCLCGQWCGATLCYRCGRTNCWCFIAQSRHWAATYTYIFAMMRLNPSNWHMLLSFGCLSCIICDSHLNLFFYVFRRSIYLCQYIIRTWSRLNSGSTNLSKRMMRRMMRRMVCVWIKHLGILRFPYKRRFRRAIYLIYMRLAVEKRVCNFLYLCVCDFCDRTIIKQITTRYFD